MSKTTHKLEPNSKQHRYQERVVYDLCSF